MHVVSINVPGVLMGSQTLHTAVPCSTRHTSVSRNKRVTRVKNHSHWKMHHEYISII